LTVRPRPPRRGDGRRRERKRTLLGGKVVSHDGALCIDCTIRDISDEGARIAIPRDKIIPTHVFFVHSRSTDAYEAEVAWIKPPEYGLKFVRRHDLEVGVPQGLEFLKDQLRLLRKLHR
jgi:hypothetical protein